MGIIFLLTILYTVYAQQDYLDLILDTTINTYNSPTHQIQFTMPQRYSNVPQLNQFYFSIDIEFSQQPVFGQEQYFIEILENQSQISEDDIYNPNSPLQYDQIYNNRPNTYRQKWQNGKYLNYYKLYTQGVQQDTPMIILLHNTAPIQQQTLNNSFNIKVYTQRDRICPHNCLNGSCQALGCKCDQNSTGKDCSLLTEKITENTVTQSTSNYQEWKFFYWTIKSNQSNKEVNIKIEMEQQQQFQYAIFIQDLDLVQDFYSKIQQSNEKIKETKYSVENKLGKELLIGVQNSQSNESTPFTIEIQQTELEKETTSYLIFIIIGIVLAFIVILLIVIFIYYKKTHAQKQQNQQQQQQQIPQQPQLQQLNNNINQNNQDNNAAIAANISGLNLGQNEADLPVNNRFNLPPINKTVVPLQDYQANLKQKMYLEEYQDIYQDLKQIDSFQCSICTSSIIKKDFIRPIQCKHLFHYDCITSWINKNNTCPLCREYIS